MTTAPTGDRMRQVPLIQRLLSRPAAGALIIAVFLWVIFAILSVRTGNPVFLRLDGTLNYLDVAAQVGILATAVALLMIAGEFDLSVGSLVGFAGIVIGVGVTEMGLPIWLAIVVSMALTTFLGVLNGLLVVRTGLPSFIVTLATMSIIAGLTRVVTAFVTNITFIPIDRTLVAADPIAWIFNWSLPLSIGGQTGTLEVSILWWIVIAVVGACGLRRTRCGSWIAGGGGSAAAARNLGVRVGRGEITLFAATAFSAAILAAVQSMTFFSADVLRGRGLELGAITTAVIGGTLLAGGYGSVAGTAIAALALGMAQIGITFAQINADWYLITIGTLLLVSVILNNYIRRRSAGIR